MILDEVNRRIGRHISHARTPPPIYCYANQTTIDLFDKNHNKKNSYDDPGMVISARHSNAFIHATGRTCSLWIRLFIHLIRQPIQTNIFWYYIS